MVKKYCVGEWFIADSIEENIQNGKDLFKHMIQCGSLGPRNMDDLADMLQEIHRRDLAEKVKKFQSEGMFIWLKLAYHLVHLGFSFNIFRPVCLMYML